MGQSQNCAAAVFLLVAALMGCGRNSAQPTTQPNSQPRIASLVPAATDLIVAMGLKDRLVAVSNYEPDRQETRNLPRVGDYQTTDWEKIRSLHPDVMIVQIAKDRVPAGLTQKAADVGVRVVNVELNRLLSVFETLNQLGKELGATDEAARAARKLRDQLAAVAQRVMYQPAVPTLIVVGSSGVSLAGADTYLDDMVAIAGGHNLARELSNPYPTIDREKLLALAPQAIIQLLPGASPQVIEQAKTFWVTMPSVPAVRDHRIYYITDSSALLPGFNVGRLTEQFAQALHPRVPATTQSTQPT